MDEEQPEETSYDINLDKDLLASVSELSEQILSTPSDVVNNNIEKEVIVRKKETNLLKSSSNKVKAPALLTTKKSFNITIRATEKESKT